MPHARRYLIEIKDAEADAVVICRAADWTDKEKHAAVVSVMRLAELPDILITKSPPCEQPLLREPGRYDLFIRFNLRKVEMPENLARNPLSVLLRAAFFGCIIALATLAWLPEKLMTRTVLGGHAEHFIAYLGTAIIMGLTFLKSPRLAVQCVLLIMWAAILEAGQLFRLVVTPLFKT